jgi:hypothetical protein
MCSVDGCTLSCGRCQQANGSWNEGSSLVGPCEGEVNNCDGELVCGACAGGSCLDCACGAERVEGGCLDVCSALLDGLGEPNFCEGADARPQCADCIGITCGASWELCTE